MKQAERANTLHVTRARLASLEKNTAYQWFLVHALHVTVIALVAAGVLDKPAVLVALGSPGQVLGSTFLRIVQVPVSHPSHVGIAMQSPQSILSPLLVHQVLKLVAGQCGPNQDQEKAEARHLLAENVSTR